jgi:O-antigen/teichoic acid export membrane protein
LSADQFGFQSAIVAFANAVMSLSYMDVFNIGLREFARHPEDQLHVYRTLLSYELSLAVVIAVGAALVPLLLNSFPGPQFIVFVLGLFTLVTSYAPIAPTEALLITQGKMGRVVILQSTYAALATVFGIAILVLGGGVAQIYVALSLVSVFMIVVYMLVLQQALPGGLRFMVDWRTWKFYLQEGLPGGLSGFFVLMARSIGTFLMYTYLSHGGALFQSSLFANVSAFGSYTFFSHAEASYLGIAYMLLSALISVCWVPFSVSILPVLARLFVRHEQGMTWLGSRSLTWMLAATLPIALGTMLLAPGIVGVLGADKVPAAPTLRIFIWVLPLTVISEIGYRILLVSRQQRFYLVAAALGAALNVILCAVLIPIYGVLGAALASVIGVGMIAICVLWRLRDWLLPHIRPADALRLGAGLVGMTLAVQFTNGLSVFIRIGAGGLVYAAIVFGVGLFNVSDWHTARKLMAVDATSQS